MSLFSARYIQACTVQGMVKAIKKENGRNQCLFFLSLAKIKVVSESMNNGRIVVSGNSGITEEDSVILSF